MNASQIKAELVSTISSADLDAMTLAELDALESKAAALLLSRPKSDGSADATCLDDVHAILAS